MLSPVRLLLLVLALSLPSLGLRAAADLQSSLDAIRAVGPEGRGNVEASAALKTLVAQQAAELPAILKAMNGAGPLAENWLRAAADTLAKKHAKALPLEALEKFLRDTSNSPAARVLCYDLLLGAQPKRAAALADSLLEDPSSELRRHPVGKLLEQGNADLAAGRKEQALTAFSQAMQSARDEDQVKELAKKLKELGKPVDLAKHFGFVRQWKLIAPFSNVERHGFDTVYPPETEIRTDAQYDGKTGKIAWKDHQSSDEYGQIDFNKPFGMIKEVVGYAYTEFDAPEALEAQIRLGCKNGWKIWLNGKLIFARDEYHRGAKLDQYKLPVKLQKGRNTLLVKCCQNEQTETWTVEWQFQLRICDATGTALALAK